MTFELVDFSEHKEEFNKRIIDDVQAVFDIVYNKLDSIFDSCEQLKPTLDPKTNSVTQSFLKDGYTLKEAYSMSFLITLSIYNNFK